VRIMAKKHWTQRSQASRAAGKAISDNDGTTWQRGYAGANAWRISDTSSIRGGGGLQFLGFTDPETKIRRGIFGGTQEYAEELERLGYTKVKFNASIREKDVVRDYKYSKHSMKKGKIFNRPVYRVKKKK